jgi:acyl carrier protein
MRQVPIGVTGELYIGGPGVACEYLNRSDLTAERFVPDPFGARAGARLYRTGDLGRWRTLGSIDFMGRNDRQVKLRGYRIELGEIETRLKEHALIRDAAVIMRDDLGGDKRLVAYVVWHAGIIANVEVLRRHLQNVLPEYMVPAAIVTLEILPLTPSGKLNRRMLPRPDAESGIGEAPLGDIEQVVASIWCEVLHRTQVARDDDFFALGGHSLSATQVSIRIRAALVVEIPIRRLFSCSTLRSLSAEIEQRLHSSIQKRARDGSQELEEILSTVETLPDAKVRELLEQLEAEVRT